MSFNNKVGQGREGHRIFTIGDTSLHLLRAEQQSDDASAPIVVDECSVVSFMLLAGGTVAGAWKVEASNDYSVGQYGQPPKAGTWKDVTAYADIVPAIVPVVDGNAATETQLCRFWPCGVRALRFSFTASAGTGDVEVWLIGKGA